METAFAFASQNELAAPDASALNLFCAGIPAAVTENFVQQLRARGVAAHCHSINSMDVLQKACAEQSIDILLIKTDNDPIKIEETVSLFERANCDAALLGWGDPAILNTINIGLRDVIEPNENNRAILVILREFRDLVTRRRVSELEAQIEDAANQCSILMESSKDAICYVHEGMHIRANAAYYELFEIPADEDIECVPMMDLVNRDSHKDLKRYLRVASHAGRDSFSLDAGCVTVDGGEFPASLDFSSVTVDGESCVQVVVREKAESQNEEALPNRDLATGLYNNNYLLANLDELIVRQNSGGTTPHALYYIAIDSYLELRNIHGLAGTELIVKDIAALLNENFGETGLVARQGEYSFVLLMPCPDEHEARKSGDKILSLVMNHAFKTSSQFTQPTVSIGIAMSNKGHMVNGQEFLDRSYRAYISAADSGNTASTYAAEQHATISQGSDDKAAVNLLEYALNHNRIEPRYQAMVHLTATGQEKNFIVTPVIMDPNDEEIPVKSLGSDFSDKLVLTDHGAIKDAVNQLVTVGNRESRVFIEISGSSVSDDKFPQRLEKLLEVLKVSPKRIAFVLNDDAARSNLHHSRIFCSTMYKTGIGVYLSEFGLKDDDLALTKQFELEGVIIHPKLTVDLHKNEAKQQDIQQILQALKQQQMQSVLHGVESASTLALCWVLGTDYAAGDFIHAPSNSLEFDFTQYS